MGHIGGFSFDDLTLLNYDCLLSTLLKKAASGGVSQEMPSRAHYKRMRSVRSDAEMMLTQAGGASKVDGQPLPVDGSVFTCAFGQRVAGSVSKKPGKKK
jgi:hypothetical protein